MTLTETQIRTIVSCIGLLNSMVNSGESHSNTSREMLKEALDILKNRKD